MFYDDFDFIIFKMNNNQEQNQGGINCSEFIGKIPFWTRTVYFGLSAFWLLDLITSLSSTLIAASLKSSIYNLYFWTFFTSCFYIHSLFFLTIVIYNFHTFLPKIEERHSSFVLAIKFLSNSAIITFLTINLQYFIGSSALIGVGGIWFNMLFKYCYYNSQNQIKFCCFNWKMKKTVYPFVLFGVCCLLQFGIAWDMLVGLLYAVIEVQMSKICCKMSNKCFYSRLGTLINFPSVKCWIQYVENREPETFDDKTLFENLQNYELSKLGSGDADEKSITKSPFQSKEKGLRIGDY